MVALSGEYDSLLSCCNWFWCHYYSLQEFFVVCYMTEIDRTTFSILFFFQFVDHNKTQWRNVELQCHTLFCYFSLYINMQAPFLTRKHIYLSLPIIFSVSIFYSILPLFIKFANDEDSHVLSIENVSKPTTFVFNRFKQASK